VTTDLVQEETFDGTLGSIADATVATRLGGTATWVPEAGAVLEAGDVLFVISYEPTELELAQIQQQIVSAESQVASAQASYENVVEEPDPADITMAQASISQAQAALDELLKPPTAGQVAMAEAEVASAQEALEALNDPPGSAAVLSAEASLATAQENLANLLEGPTEADILQAEADLATAEAGLADLIAGPPSSDRSLAWASVEIAQANLDTALLQQETLAAGPVPTVLLFGSSTAWRALSIDSAPGPDIAQLEENLFALGYDPEGSMILDDVYDEATVAAVERWQEDLGAEDDGVVNLGEVVFLSGEVRITDQLVSEGSGVDPGSPVLGISLSDKVVRVDLPADKQGSLVAGDAVTVELPDSTEVPAAVVSVSQTATPSEFGPATFEVLIELDDPAAAAGLDEAPVDVIAVSDSVDNVMAVPVSALVALLEGGYAVEIDAGGGVAELVAVEVGFFGSDNMIEVTSAALEPGDRVVVP
jgi:multidrug resistance efflux pump